MSGIGRGDECGSLNGFLDYGVNVRVMIAPSNPAKMGAGKETLTAQKKIRLPFKLTLRLHARNLTQQFITCFSWRKQNRLRYGRLHLRHNRSSWPFARK